MPTYSDLTSSWKASLVTRLDGCLPTGGGLQRYAIHSCGAIASNSTLVASAPARSHTGMQCE